MDVSISKKKKQKSIKVFCCYAHEDEGLLNKLKGHLSPLQHLELITVWHDRNISAGAVWDEEIKWHLSEAKIILLLISPDFMSSQYCYDVEMQYALERHENGEATVIPVILRPAYWHIEPLDKLQALPTDGEPVTSKAWDSQDKAFYTIVLGIRNAVESRIAKEEQLQKAEEAKQARVASAIDHLTETTTPKPRPPSTITSPPSVQAAPPIMPSQPFLPTVSPHTIRSQQSPVSLSTAASRQEVIPSQSSATFPLPPTPKLPRSWLYGQSKHFREYLSTKIILAIPALVLIVLSFPDLLKSVPLFEWMSSYPVTTPIIGGALVLLILPHLIISFAIEPQNSRKVPITKKNPKWVIATALATTGFLLSSLLLAVALIRPQGCPTVFCAEIVPQGVTNPQGVHDANLEAFLITKPQSPFFTIPGNPAQYTQTDLPQSIGAVRLDEKPSVSFYHIVIGIRSLQQGRYGVDIMHVGLEILQTPATPRPLNVWSQGLPQDYHTNPYLAVYNGQLSGSIIPATYTPSPLADVTLLPGEPEQLDIQVNSHVLAYIQFRVQITYRVTNLPQTQTHLLTLPNSFEVIFSNALNWNTYQNQEGHFVRSS